METPKTVQNSTTGSSASIAPVAVNWKSPSRCPSWKIQTIAPYPASSEQTFMITAFTGSTTLRSIRKRTRPVTPTTKAMIQGNRL